jgi:acyl homoserine lactone synthase
MDAMFRNRAETFSDRLGWEVVVKNGHEQDSFDDANPLYLVSVDPDSERYWGSLRLLPTIGPNMLRDVFPRLLEPGEIIESAILGIAEVAVLAGLTQIVSVFDARILRVLRTVGCSPGSSESRSA